LKEKTQKNGWTSIRPTPIGWSIRNFFGDSLIFTGPEPRPIGPEGRWWSRRKEQKRKMKWNGHEFKISPNNQISISTKI
jgi:hypothetical protein